MSAPLRFLGVAIVAYVGLRTASSALALEPMPAMRQPLPAGGGEQVAELPPGVAADMGPQEMNPEQLAAAQMAAAAGQQGYGSPYGPLPVQPAMAPQMAPGATMIMPYPVMPAMMPSPRQRYQAPLPAAWQEQAPAWRAPQPPPMSDPGPPADEYAPSNFSAEIGETPPLEQWPAIGTAGPFSVGRLQQTPSWGGGKADGAISAARSRNMSLDLWALARQPRSGLLSFDDPDAGLNPGLASGGSLGGSQAGMRLTWRPLPRVGVHLRASTALLPQGTRGHTLAGGEGSVGISYQPVGGLPVRLLAERRQRFGPALGGGRDAFALLAEAGIYDRQIARGFRLDGYGQAGMVGARSRTLFADGALTATAPILPRFALGGGMWGGVQPGLSRFDAGPRLSYQLSPLLRLHLDYRVRVTGRADPPSGPALTVGGGF